jgi:hypothetical protein
MRTIVEGEGINKTVLSEQFDRGRFLESNGQDVTLLAAVREGRLLVNVVDAPTSLTDRLAPGDTVLWVDAGEPVTSTRPDRQRAETD